MAALILAERTSDFSEEIAEALSFPSADRARLRRRPAAASCRRSRGFAAWWRSDALQLEPGPARKGEMAGTGAHRHVRGVQAGLELTAERIFQLQAEGRRDEAIGQFKLGVEQGRDGALQRRSTPSCAEEQAEFVEVERRIDRGPRSPLSLAVMAPSSVLLTISLFAGRTLFRAFVRPVQALSAAAAALRLRRSGASR